MDRRSWLWRRKSSEKSPNGETESSGSLSSHSERFSDEQVQTLSNNNAHSPEVTSKASLGGGDEANDDLKALTEKLSDAMVTIRAKEDLVKQHAKVAEEAVSGWERAENEVSALKKLIDALTQKNAVLEERVGHLDGALKECLRQLRQAREEQEEKISETVSKRTQEWESQKSQLEKQLTESQNGARSKIEAAEKENAILKHNLRSATEELELRIHERDLSTNAAETASKQHLEGIKKVARLEAECRRLKALARRGSNLAGDSQSIAGSSACVESFTDSQSDSGERMHSIDSEIRDRNLNTRSLMVPSVEIDLMDDFLEMEKAAALPEARSQSNLGNAATGELEAMRIRVKEVETKLVKVTEEKENLEIAMKDNQDQLKTYEDLLKQTEDELIDVRTQLGLAIEAKEATEIKLENSTKLLHEAEANLNALREELSDAKEMKDAAEVKLDAMESEVRSLESRIGNLEAELEKEREFSKETEAKCWILQEEASRTKDDVEHQRLAIVEEFRATQDQELAKAAGKYAECQATIASIGRQLKSLAKFDDFLIESE